MLSLIHDTRYALRNLRRNPGFATIAFLSLGLGIGANTAIFSLMDRALLRTLPVKNPEQLVLLSAKGPRAGSVLATYDSDYTFSYPMYRDFRDRAPGFDGVIAWFESAASLSLKGQNEYVNAVLVSGNYFDVLGVRTVLGRPIQPDDIRAPGTSPIIVLTHNFWVRRFGADPAVLNQPVIVNGTPMTVVGVAAPGFNGTVMGEAPAFFVPVTMESQIVSGRVDLEKRRSSWLMLMARMKPGVTAKGAEAMMNAFWRPILQEEAKDLGSSTSAKGRERFLSRRLTIVPGGNGVPMLRDMFQEPLFVLMALVGLVLLIACANVANLLLARAVGRQKEIAVRLALGASRGDIIRQTLVESGILAVGGGAIGILLASWTGGILLRLLPLDGITEAISSEPDLRILAFTATVSIFCGLLFGLAPALQFTRPDLVSTLKQQAGNVMVSLGDVLYRKILVIAQVALSLLLLVGAGLFLKSFQNLKNINAGFRTDHLMTFSIDASLSRYDEPHALALFDRLQDKLRGLPGVRSVSYTHTPLLTGTNWGSSITVPGHTPKEDERSPNVDYISPGFMSTVSMPLVAGREFTAADSASAPKVAVVNEAFVSLYMDTGSALGRSFYFAGEKNKTPVEIVGVVKDGKYADLREKKQVFVFVPYAQKYAPGTTAFYVRTSQDPETIASALRQTLRETDSNLPMFAVKTMDQQIDESVFTDRLISGLSAFFGFLATALAAIGLYGVMSYMVTRRTREIGIRMALGAGRGAVVKLVLSEVAVLIGVGVGIALPAAYYLSRLTQSLLFQVGPNDPLIVAGATALLVSVALLAGYVPAARATRVDPMSALRNE
jgi:predicted permease